MTMPLDHTIPQTSAEPSFARVPKASRALRLATFLQVLAAAGSGLTFVTISLRIYQQTHSPTAATGVLLAGGLPVVLLSPVSGLLLDRLHMGRLLAGAALLTGCALGGLVFVHSYSGTVALVLCFGIADSVLQPGITAAIPQLRGDVPLLRATSRLQGAQMGGTAIGPLLAGVVTGLGGVTSALVLDAGISLTFASGILLLGLHRVEQVSDAATDDGVAAGLRYLRRDRPMGLLVLVITLMLAFLGVTLVAELFLAEKVLHGGTTGYALLVTAWTGGMTLGTVIAGRLSARAVAPAIVIGLAVLGLGVMAGSLAPTMWMAVVAYGIGGIGDGVQMVGARALLLQRAPAHIAGRACAIFTGSAMGAVCLGTGLAGPLVGALGIRGALFLAGAAGVASAGVALLWRLHRMRGEETLPEADEGPALASGAPALI
jgi:MFS family permease